MRKVAFVFVLFVCSLLFLFFIWHVKGEHSNDKELAILHASGLLGVDSDDDLSLRALYHNRIIPRKVNLDSGRFVDNENTMPLPQRCTILPPEQDLAKIKRRCRIAEIFLVKGDDNKIQQIIIPIFGKGARSMMYAFLSLELDGRTVRNLYYYRQRETPFVGDKVENKIWLSQWAGKKLLDEGGKVILKINNGRSIPGESNVDGISGATITSSGVEKTIKYWMGPRGYGRFLNILRKDPGIINS